MFPDDHSAVVNPDQEIRRGPTKNVWLFHGFWAPQPCGHQLWSKNKGGGPLPGWWQWSFQAANQELLVNSLLQYSDKNIDQRSATLHLWTSSFGSPTSYLYLLSIIALMTSYTWSCWECPMSLHKLCCRYISHWLNQMDIKQKVEQVDSWCYIWQKPINVNLVIL